MNESSVVDFKNKSLLASPEAVDRILEKVRYYFSFNRPKEKDFYDIYDKNEIKKDLDDIKKIKDIWQKENGLKEIYLKKVSETYEGAIISSLDFTALLGENCLVVPTSEYDDIKNGIDAVCVFYSQENSDYLGLGFDVTYNKQKDSLEKKFESIKQCIRSGSLPSLKYFSDPKTAEHQKVSLPKVIIGSEITLAEKFILSWDKMASESFKIKESPVLASIIYQTIKQAEYFYLYAKRLHNKTKDSELKEKYSKIMRAYALLNNVFVDIYDKNKELIEKNYKAFSQDFVCQTILELSETDKNE